MVDSDKSDNDESHVTGKRPHEYNSEDEKLEHPSKRLRSESPEHQDDIGSKKDRIAQVTNGRSQKSSATYVDTKVSIKSEDVTDVEMEVSKLDEKSKEDSEKEETEGEEISKTIKLEEDTSSLDKSRDSEVVDGLELSVECASDKVASSSESDRAEDSKPRPKTIIVKADPNDSELEVGSSEAEKSENDEDDDTDKKRVGKRKSLSKVSNSRSEDSAESNSDDEAYSPHTRKNIKKNSPKKTTSQKTKTKKEHERKKKPASDSEDEKSRSEDDEMSLAARGKKKSVGSNDKAQEKDESDSENSDESDSSKESDDKNKKNGKPKSKEMNSMEKKIQNLKKYITTAGIRVKYADLWSGCKNNRQRIERMKKLLEDNGIKGRPTLEKCRSIKKRNATKKEVAELDTSNIISEGRVTRARRKEADKALGKTPTKEQDTRNTFKRIQPVCDSDTE